MTTQPKSEAIQQEIERYKAELKQREERYDKACAPYNQKLAELTRAYNVPVRYLTGKVDKLEKELDEAQVAEEFATVTARHDEVVKAGEFNEGNVFDYLQGLLGQRMYVSEDRRKLTKYPNGTSVLRVQDSYEREVWYYLFHGLRLVGFNWTERSAHPGDPQTSFSWLGIPTPTSKNIMRGEKTFKNYYGREVTETRPLTMRDVVAKLSAADKDSFAGAKWFKSISLKSEKTRELLAKGVQHKYGEW